MKKPTLRTLASVTLAAVSLSGCAIFPQHHWWWAKNKPTTAIRPAPLPAAAPQSMADDGLYADAVQAISHRDYASALDLLQTARARDPKDPRVMNAFGVVYDKLGRFDLSPRYYAQAEALDPGSPIVANNRAYSLLMQSKRGPAPATAFAQALPSPQPRAAPVPAAPERLASGRAVKAAGVEVALVTAGADFDKQKVGTQ